MKKDPLDKTIYQPEKKIIFEKIMQNQINHFISDFLSFMWLQKRL